MVVHMRNTSTREGEAEGLRTQASLYYAMRSYLIVDLRSTEIRMLSGGVPGTHVWGPVHPQHGEKDQIACPFVCGVTY